MIAKFKAKDIPIRKLLISHDESLLIIQGDDEFV